MVNAHSNLISRGLGWARPGSWFSSGSLLMALLFALFTSIGNIFSTHADWYYLSSTKETMLFIALFFVFTAVYYVLIRVSEQFFDNHSQQKAPAPQRKRTGCSVWLVRRRYLFALLCIVVLWLPWVAVYNPGSISYDAARQLFSYLGLVEWTTIDAPAMTLLFGTIFSIGNLVDANLGIFLIVIMQLILCSTVFALVCKRVYDHTLNNKFFIAAIAFFTILPFWGVGIASVNKDLVFCAFTVLLTVLITDIIYSKKKLDIPMTIAIATIGICTLLSKHPGVYIVMPTLVVMIFLLKGKQRAIIAATNVLILAVYFGFSLLVVPQLGVTKINQNDLFDITFFQTGRYVRDHDQDLSLEQKQVLVSTFPRAQDITEVGDNYNPLLVDGVRNLTDQSESGWSTEEKLDYLAVWLQLFSRHPGTCLQAFANSNYGVYYPFKNVEVFGQSSHWLNVNNIDEFVVARGIDGNDVPKIQYSNSNNVRAVAQKYLDAWFNLPILGWLSGPGLYTWLILLLLYHYFRSTRMGMRRPTGTILVFLIPVLSILVCLAAPSNGELRYALPYIGCIPLLAAVCIRQT
jgi:hypothetical protein